MANTITEGNPILEFIGGGVFDYVLHAANFVNDTIIEVEDSDDESKEGPPCDKCVSAKRAHYCCKYTTCIGHDCPKSTIIINGVDFNELVARVKSIERYIVAREIERQTTLPSDIAVEITKYF